MKASIIICCFDEEAIIEKTYKKIRDIVRCIDYELIFVDDGSGDNTLDILEVIEKKDKRVRIVHYPINMGYGYALRYGLKKAKGDIIICLDADLSMDPFKVIQESFDRLDNWYIDMVIFSRHKGIKSNYPLKRKIASWGYRTWNRFWLDTQIRDTQSGFIAFKRKILKQIGSLRMNGFSGSLELIVKTLKEDFEVVEVPMKFKHKTESGETTILKHIIPMAVDTLKIKRMLK